MHGSGSGDRSYPDSHRPFSGPYDRPHDTRKGESVVSVLDEILTGVREDIAARAHARQRDLTIDLSEPCAQLRQEGGGIG